MPSKTNAFRIGKILYGLGNVLESQGRFDESMKYHSRCFEQYKEVLGMKHRKVGDVVHKLAGHCVRRQQYNEAVYDPLMFILC